MKPLTLILCLLCMAPVTRKGAETLVLLAKKGQRQKALAAMVPPLPPTNAPTLRAIIHPPPKTPTNIVVTFKYPQFTYNAKPQNMLYELAWTTNLRTSQTSIPAYGTFLGTNSAGLNVYARAEDMPKGWQRYCFTSTNLNVFKNTNSQTYFIIRTFDTANGFYSEWARWKP